MGINLGDVTGAGAVGQALDTGLKIIDKFIPDPALKVEAENALRKDLMGWDAGQQKINEAEASSGNIWASGWRPAIGWTCAAAFFYTYLMVPITMYGGFLIGHPIPKPPVLDANLWELTTILLGVGGLRTYEKKLGIAK